MFNQISPKKNKETKRKSIFKALFIPLFFIMIIQAITFFCSAVFGGTIGTLEKNAGDILNQTLINRKNELESMFTKTWTNLSSVETKLSDIYSFYIQMYGEKPLVEQSQAQIDFLSDTIPDLINTLRGTGVNGIFLILNDDIAPSEFHSSGEEKKGLCIRVTDQTSNSDVREDLLVVRAPSSLIPVLGFPMDSWWEPRYTFKSKEEGDFFYKPLQAAWDNPESSGKNLAYFQGSHNFSKEDPSVISYSIPLRGKDGFPYAILGVELTTKYLGTLMPSDELGHNNKACYVLALSNYNYDVFTPIVGTGAFYNRYFIKDENILTEEESSINGITTKGRDGSSLLGKKAQLLIYNNNNPFENGRLTLLSFVDKNELFSYVKKIVQTLTFVTIVSLVIGLLGIVLVSRHFSEPITNLSNRVQTLPPKDGFTLGRLGITEIDQLVESIENLNRNASRNTARTEFFSQMSHDMRTPMNAIIGFSSKEILENSTEEQKLEYLDKIHSSGEYLLGLINEVLDMTKIESNKIDYQYDSMNISKIWETIIPIIDKLAQKKNINFIQDIKIQDSMVVMDILHINQVIMNLLSNAVKFTPEYGQIKLSVCEQPDSAEKNKLNCVIKISDTGIGMSTEFMQHMYSPFEQENNNKEGTGLGLSIAKKLTQQMGGTIECQSEKEKGTTFTVKFTFEKSKDEQTETQAQNKISENDTKNKNTKTADLSLLKGKKILVCEDQPMNINLITLILNHVGIEVTTAENGLIGLEKFSASEDGFFDAIIMDIRMPVMDGLQATKAIRNLSSQYSKEIPIIAMTANAFSEDIEACQKAGMNKHLSKPIEVDKLYSTLLSYFA